MAQTEKVGDKSYYEVRGNVKMISYKVYDVEFNKEGQALCLGYTKTRKKGNAVEYIVSNMVGDMVTTYDNKGRLIKHEGFEIYIRNMKYDDSDNLIYYESVGEGYDESETRTYDSLGYCCKKIKKVQEAGEETEETNTYTYTVLQKDAQGNWTKRKDNNGDIESRKIYYY